MNIELKKQLSISELADLAAVIEAQEKDISLVGMNYNDRLELLLTGLITERQNRLIARLIKNAELKYPNASLESLDCDARGINKEMIINLASMGTPDTGVKIKDINLPVESYEYTYSKVGTYKATFVMSNENFEDAQQKLVEFVINVVESL